MKKLGIWNLFELKSVDIVYLNEDWQVKVGVIIFDQKLSINYENG